MYVCVSVFNGVGTYEFLVSAVGDLFFSYFLVSNPIVRIDASRPSAHVNRRIIRHGGRLGHSLRHTLFAFYFMLTNHVHRPVKNRGVRRWVFVLIITLYKKYANRCILTLCELGTIILWQKIYIVNSLFSRIASINRGRPCVFNF